MKNTLLVVLCLFTLNVAQAQYKGNVSKAESNLTKGNYVDAIGEIEEAIKDEKNASKSKTWFTRGKIYAEIARNENPEVNALAPDALELATASLAKTMEMEKEGSPSYFFASGALDDLWGAFINRGGEAYGEDEYVVAYDNFMKALQVKPGDSLTNFYAAAAAQSEGNYGLANERYYEMIENGQANKDVFSTVIFIERAENKNEEKALEVVLKAKELFPDDDVFSKEEINILISLERVDEAREKLQREIQSDPENIALHLNLGILFDNLGASEISAEKFDSGRDAYAKALKAYDAAIGLDENNFMALYNSGAVHVNLAKIYLDAARDMDLKTYQKEGPKLTAKAQEDLNKALPFLEKAHASDGEDTDAMRALYQVYQQLKMNEKANQIYEKLQAVEGNEG